MISWHWSGNLHVGKRIVSDHAEAFSIVDGGYETVLEFLAGGVAGQHKVIEASVGLR